MAHVIGQIDSLTSLLNIFKENGINYFRTLHDISHFRSNYSNIVRSKYMEVTDKLKEEINRIEQSTSKLADDYDQKILEREKELLDEKEKIKMQIEKYSTSTNKFLKKVYHRYKLYLLNKRKKLFEDNFENEKKRPFLKNEKELQIKKEKIVYLKNNFDHVVQERFQVFEEKYNLANSLIEENISMYLGAIGEQKALDTLKALPDTYYIINGYSVDIKPPIYNKNTGDHIGSIQADHIVVGPGGVFLIETKNWSNKSIQNRDFYSPVEQLKRTSYVLFILLNDAGNYDDSILEHHWGSKKVSVRSILLMINSKPNQEFQYVKMLTLNEILGYIKYFKPLYSPTEVKAIYDVFINL